MYRVGGAERGLTIPQTERQKSGAREEEWSFAGVLRISRKAFWRSHKSRSIRGLWHAVPPTRTQTRGSLNPIGAIAVGSKWLSRELNRIGFQR